MSILHLGSELQCLAARLADRLVAGEERGDFFTPVTVIVPNRYMRKWLRLWLSRRLGACINLRFLDLEQGLWELLRAVDPRPHSLLPDPLDENTYRLLALAVLLEDRDPSLGPLQRYIQLSPQTLTRLSCRRAWQLAERTSALIQEYEYHRQTQLVQPWLRNQIGLSQAGTFHHMMERAQRTLLQNIAREGDGKHALLNALAGRDFRTFPQYAVEAMEQARPPKRDCVIHCFGLTQTSDLHARVLGWLGDPFDVHLYHLNALASRVRGDVTAESLQAIAETLRDPEREDERPDRGKLLLRSWGRAGAEALGLIARVLSTGHFTAEVLEPIAARPLLAKGRGRRSARRAAPTVLSRLHDQLLDRPTLGTRRVPQDTSLQIVACPGVVREIETVHNSILDNLQRNPGLRQSDVAVLVSDMARYRPILQAVFERPPRRLQYNLVDFSAAGLSMFGQALLGMLDLALESFTRTRVFEVLLNPCFLARLGIDRTQALTWLGWAETLGIYEGWDAGEKHEQGYARSPFYAWRLALQRLRLGRYMEVSPDDGDEPAPRFGHVIPFADVHCADREHLDAFCRAVEMLLPALARLRNLSGSGQRWAGALQRLVQDFLDIPADRPEEEQVRTEILTSLERLARWDHLRPERRPSAGLPLALVREYVQTQLEAVEGSRGEYLTGGVTLAGLQPMRPIPFQIVYVVGLDAELFPGSNALSSFDLRSVKREPGDIRPAEERTYVLLENVLAAQQKLYLLYNNLDVQREQALLPSVPLQQLQRYLTRHVTRGAFEQIEMPMHSDDDPFYNQAAQPDFQDVLVQYRDADRFLAFSAAVEQGRLTLDLHQQAELKDKAEALKIEFAIPRDPRPAPTVPITVSTAELRRFLQFPAKEALRRHLRIEDAEEPEVEDEEPLVTSDATARQIVRQALHQLVRRAAGGRVQQALDEWPDRFRAAFADGRLRSQVPEDAFGDIDEKLLHEQLQERIHGKGKLENFLRERAQTIFCGPTLLGESITPIGAKMRFPALRLRAGHELPAEGPEVRVVGSTPFAWFTRDMFEILAITTSSKLDARELCLPMIEPLLLYLALLANPEPNVKAIAAKDWLARRDFRLHVAYAEGIHTWKYPIGLIAPDEAARYLAQLVRDFLDPAQIDLLPFELITSGPSQGIDLRRVYDERATSHLSAEEYLQILEEKLADVRANSWQKAVQVPHIADMAGARVPADALVKVQRRFRLLDRGTALRRQSANGPRSRKTLAEGTP